MTVLIQKSTATVDLPFLMVLTSDHITGATGLSPTVTIRKQGGSFGSPAGAVSELADGWYIVAANATDSNTYGPILLHATAATADPSDSVVAMVVGFDPSLTNLLANVAAINSVATTSVTTVAAVQGTTIAPVFNGSNIKADVVQINEQTATAAAGVTFPTSIASPTNITAGTITTVTNLTNAATAGDFTATMKTSITTAATASSPILDWSKVANQSSVVVLSNTIVSEVVNVNNILTGGITAATFAAWTEGYTILGTASSYTLPNLMFDIQRNLYARSVSGTTESILEMDGVTTAHQITLNSSTSPTSAIQSS